MSKIRITPQYIKEYIEGITDVKDLSIKKRTRDLSDIRCIAFTITKEFCKVSLLKIGKLYKRDHATVLHGIKRFNNLKDMPYFKEDMKLYNQCMSHFLKYTEYDEKKVLKKLQTVIELRQEYLEHIDKISREYEQTIKEQRIALDNLKNNPLLKKCAELPKDKFNELAVRINAFLEMDACNKQRKNNLKKLQH